MRPRTVWRLLIDSLLPSLIGAVLCGAALTAVLLMVAVIADATVAPLAISGITFGFCAGWAGGMVLTGVAHLGRLIRPDEELEPFVVGPEVVRLSAFVVGLLVLVGVITVLLN
ncbi:MAG: hypothetical protein AAF488_02030 [Planctomycetota bacterium]